MTEAEQKHFIDGLMENLNAIAKDPAADFTEAEALWVAAFWHQRMEIGA